jgi:hypothetical protein
MPLYEPPPYEVLGVPPTAGVREINVAVGPAMKAGRYTRQEIQEAAALLRNPERRLEADLQTPLPSTSAGSVLDILAPVLEEPLLVIERAPLPSPSALLTVRREELEADFEELPPIGNEPDPAIPARFAVSLSVLPPIEFP